MSDMVSNLAGKLSELELSEPLQAASRVLAMLVEDNAYVSEVYSLDYDEVLVQLKGSLPTIEEIEAELAGGMGAEKEDRDE